MKVTAITPNNFAKVCVASGILPEVALTEELPDGSFWARDASGEWVEATDAPTDGFYALDPETGEWEQI